MADSLPVVRVSAGAGEPGRAVNPLPRAEQVRILPHPSYEPTQGNEASRGRRSALVRALEERDGCECFYCGDASARLHVDHVVARIHGGSDSSENLVLACQDCNQRKSCAPGWAFVIMSAVGLSRVPKLHLSVRSLTWLLCPRCDLPLSEGSWARGFLTCRCGHTLARSRSHFEFRAAIATTGNREEPQRMQRAGEWFQEPRHGLGWHFEPPKGEPRLSIPPLTQHEEKP